MRYWTRGEICFREINCYLFEHRHQCGIVILRGYLQSELWKLSISVEEMAAFTRTSRKSLSQALKPDLYPDSSVILGAEYANSRPS